MERKLTAILSADVEGYSRLMGEDEEATIRTLTSYRQVMATLIPMHRGRVVDSPGDNLLAEFGSVVDAVQYAVVIQTTLRAENANLEVDETGSNIATPDVKDPFCTIPGQRRPNGRDTAAGNAYVQFLAPP